MDALRVPGERGRKQGESYDKLYRKDPEMFEVLRDLMKEDLEKVEAAAFARGYACGYARGYARGYACGTIKAYARVGKSPSEIVELVMTDCGLSRETAEQYVEETLGLQLVDNGDVEGIVKCHLSAHFT